MAKRTKKPRPPSREYKNVYSVICVKDWQQKVLGYYKDPITCELLLRPPPTNLKVQFTTERGSLEIDGYAPYRCKLTHTAFDLKVKCKGRLVKGKIAKEWGIE